MIKITFMFFFGGPFILAFGWFVDIGIYAYNIYTVPDHDEFRENAKSSISHQTL